MTNRKVALGLGAHPDDAEFLYAGTLALLKQKGWDIHIATMTPGDCGTKEYTREEISRIRKAEAANAAAILDAGYTCLECGDVFIMYDRPTLLKVIELIRRVQPTIVFSLCHEDYMIDHTTTAQLAQTGCFCCGVPNIEIAGVETFEPVPYLYYAEPLEGKDIYGNPISPHFFVDITSTFETKKQMLACHQSQRDWLLKHHGIDEYVESMEQWSASRGGLIQTDHAEGFRQHLGHAYPRDNILKTELGDAVHAQ